MARLPSHQAGLPTVIAAIILALCSPCAAAESPNTITLDECVQATLKSNYTIMAAKEDVEAARAARGVAISAFLPRIDVSETYMRTDNPVMDFGARLDQGRFTSADFNPQRLNDPAPIGNFNFRAQLTQPVFNGGREFLGLKKAGLGLEAAARSAERTRQEVISQVVQAYYGVALAVESVKVAEASFAATGEHLRTAEKFFGQGMVIGSEVLLAKVRLAEEKEALIRAKNREATSKAGLNMLMARPQETEFEAATPLTAPDFPSKLPELQDEALKARPDLAGVELELKSMGEGVRLAKTDYLPGLNVIARYEKDTRDISGGAGNSYTLLGVINWNLFDGMRTTNAVCEARARMNSAADLRDRMRDSVLFEVRQAYNNLEEARLRIDAASNSVEEADESLRILRARFQSGLAKTLDILDSETALTRARMNRLQALYDYNVSLAAVKLAVGRPGY